MYIAHNCWINANGKIELNDNVIIGGIPGKLLKGELNVEI